GAEPGRRRPPRTPGRRRGRRRSWPRLRSSLTRQCRLRRDNRKRNCEGHRRPPRTDAGANLSPPLASRRPICREISVEKPRGPSPVRPVDNGWQRNINERNVQMRKAIELVLGGLVVLGGCAADPAGTVEPAAEEQSALGHGLDALLRVRCPTTVPAAVNPPADATLEDAFGATGVQIYVCNPPAVAGGAPAWTLKAPHALLFH